MLIQIKKSLLLAAMLDVGALTMSGLSYWLADGFNLPEWVPYTVSISVFVVLSLLIFIQSFVNIQLIKKTSLDALTGLLNRAAFNDYLASYIDKAKKENTVFHLLMIDLNKFKQVNDTLGHHVGDELLKVVAIKLQESVRDQDIVARLGGDEFAVLIDDPHNARSYEPTVARISKNIGDTTKVDGHYLYVGASIGVASFPDTASTAVELMRCSDIAMYSAKRAQKEYAVYRIQDDTYHETDLTLAGEIRSAVEDGDFVVWYQPKKDVATGTVISVECLVRWQHPVKGLIPPCSFIPAAETSGVIKYLTQYVIKESTQGYATLVNEGFDLNLSVNVSPNDIIDPTIMTTIIKSIVKAEMAPEKLILEVTETAIMHDPEAAFKVLVALESLGIKLSIDDFGTGHSSLTYLKNFPIHEIKLDRSFISDIEISKEGYNIVKSTIELAHSLRSVVVAEGVESAAVEQILTELGCDQLQGYHIARPMPLPDLVQWLHNYNKV